MDIAKLAGAERATMALGGATQSRRVYALFIVRFTERAMKTSTQGRALIRACEGCKLTAYRDAVNVLTIGVGHTTAAGPPTVTAGMTITGAEADSILASDLSACERDVARLVTVPLNQSQFDALVSWVFNLGAGNLAKSTLLKRLNVGDYQGAADEILKWNRAGGRVLPGLTKRRKAERLMFLGHPADALQMVGANVASVTPAHKPAPVIKTEHTAAAGAATAAGAAAASAGLPWYVIAGAVVVAAVVAFLIFKNRS